MRRKSLHVLKCWMWILGVVVASSGLASAQEEGRTIAREDSVLRTAGTSWYPAAGGEPAGFYIISPDNEGRSSFDPSLAYSLQRALDSVRASLGVKGASAAVLIPGQGTWQGVSGISSANPPVNINPSMLFGIGSNTKAFVSMTILSLADAGLLSLDDPLSKYLPSYPYITTSVTIRQLLNMTSGLFDYLNDSNAQGEAVAANPWRLWTPEELITTFVGPAKASPGGSYAYCNTNYVLLGMIINRVTGSSVSSQMRARILTPLALDHTFLEVEEPYSDPVAHPWDSGIDFAAVPVTAHFSTLWTAGGIMSTAEDMARWVKRLYEGAVISQSSLTQMLTFIPASSTVTTGLAWNGYGLGVRQGTYYGKRVLGHAGAIMGYISITAYLPSTGSGFAVLYNVSSGSTGRTLSALFDAYLRTVSTLPARPGVCYAISGSSDQARVYLADSTTGTLTAVGASAYGDITGARVHPQTGMFWGLAKAVTWELVQIDGETGEAYPRVRVQFPSGAPTDFKGLAFSADGTLYVGSVDGRVYTINTANGVATLAASTGIPISGLAFDPANGALWASVRTSATLRDRLYKIAPGTGDTVGVGNTGFNQALADLTFDAEGNLFGLVGNPTSSLKYRLARIDKETGIGTEIGSVGLSGMVGIAFSPKLVETQVDQFALQGIPADFGLEQNYPNPFNPRTTIGYRVAARGVGNSASGNSWVRLAVYDLLGHEVAVLVDGEKTPGTYAVSWDAGSRPSGVYFYRMHVWPTGFASDGATGSFVTTRRLMFLK
jgi:D-alanyl-D-alanine carboxypeptidase